MTSKKLFQPTSKLWSVFFLLFAITALAQQPCANTFINSYVPSSGPVGTIITINGSGFNLGVGSSSVRFNGIQSPGYTVVSDTQILAVVPVGATTGTIRVTTNGCVAAGNVFTVLSSSCMALPELYISELYDHVPLSYGMIELYNPSPTNTINFNGEYVLERFGDDFSDLTNPTLTASYTLVLDGSILPESTYMVASRNNAGDPGCSVPFNVNMGSGINEDDVFRIKKNNVVIDIAKAPDHKGYTVKRKSNAGIVAPTAVYNAADWDFLSMDCSDLGEPNGPPATGRPVANIIMQPHDYTTCIGNQVSFSTIVSPAQGAIYQWKTLSASGSWVNITGSNFSGVTTATLLINGVTAALDDSQYYCVITTPGCTLITDAVQLNVAPQEVITATTIDPTTCTATTGTLTVTAPLGTQYEYSIDGSTFQSGTTFTLPSGSYTVTVRNMQGCTSVSLPYVINPTPAAPIAATVTTIDPTSCTSTTGRLTVTAPLGTQYEYSVDGSTFQSGTTFTLPSGSYTVTVRNTQGCTSVSTPYVINPAPAAPIAATATTIDPTSCTATTGTLTVTAPLGTQYEYSVDGSTFQSGTTFTLPSGSYTITVRNTQGCTSMSTPYIINPASAAPIAATATTIDPISCTATNGTLTVTAPLGTQYEYSVDGSTFQSGTTFTLPSGSYTVTVRNMQGCASVSIPYIINPAPAAPIVAVAITADPTCIATNGTLTVTAPLGTQYEYSVDGSTFQSGTTFTLPSGSYTITVRNTQGCTSMSTPYIINPASAAPIAATATTIDPTSCTSTTGRLTVTAPLGTQYEYSVDGSTFQSGITFTLPSGSYTVTVRNTQGCTSVSSPYVINPAPAAPIAATAITTDPATCTATTGTLTVTAPLGAQYEYSVDGSTFQSGTTFTLPSGSYNITVRNVQGCTSVSIPYIINQPVGPLAATATAIDPTCGTTSGTLIVTAPLGAGYQYSINGGAFQSGAIFSVIPGSYSITVQNTLGCTSVSAPYIINPAPAAPVAATATVINATCSTLSGSLTITAPLGAEYQYSVNGGAFQSGTSFLLPAGSYIITVQNAQGCTSVSNPVIINPSQTGQPELTGTQGCRPTTNGSNYILEGIPLNNSFITTNVQFEWRIAGQASVLGNDTIFNVTEYSAVNNIKAEDYPLLFEVTVITLGGCTDEYTFTVDGIFCDIPRGISPNDDDKNDRFDLTGLNVGKIEIFNRYGLNVYKKSDYTNEWFGQTNGGDELPTGTYYYVINIGNETKTGWVYVNRSN